MNSDSYLLSRQILLKIIDIKKADPKVIETNAALEQIDSCR